MVKHIISSLYTRENQTNLNLLHTVRAENTLDSIRNIQYIPFWSTFFVSWSSTSGSEVIDSTLRIDFIYIYNLFLN